MCRILMVVVVLEGQVFVLAVVGNVVVVVKVMQFHELNQADFFLMANNMVDEVVEKIAHFQDSINSLVVWRGSHQKQQ